MENALRGRFIIPHPFKYPDNNELEFERWMMDTDNLHIGDRELLPITWTAYYCKHNFGKDPRAIQELQAYIDALPKNRKYYTVVQYDDGILNDLRELDVKVFNMSGGGIYCDHSLPLIGSGISTYSPIPKALPGAEKSSGVIFIGKSDTHPIRQQIKKVAESFEGICAFYDTSTSAHRPIPVGSYIDLMGAYSYALAPRGYGRTSFRLYEALAAGCVPVYIADEDELFFPYDMTKEEFCKEFGAIVISDMLELKMFFSDVAKGNPDFSQAMDSLVMGRSSKPLLSYDTMLAFIRITLEA